MQGRLNREGARKEREMKTHKERRGSAGSGPLALLFAFAVVALFGGPVVAADAVDFVAFAAQSSLHEEKPNGPDTEEEEGLVIPVKLLKPTVNIFTGLMTISYEAPEHAKSFRNKIIEAVRKPTFETSR